ncbi:zinc ribbon domain-containing protein [Bifidobacterium parmae]|uniref:Heme utilization protein n=1 Tax=Bifidobacterium parmae TaxID=361854 RepID=A0A2N5IVU4_9BIFI|nr:zinc ribbon domain-containing protein [Bifidobacterium parmae]PLS26079.1 heme utilization protein [Bifidobacterium parmae]
MICSRCGATIAAGNRFCTECGQPTQPVGSDTDATMVDGVGNRYVPAPSPTASTVPNGDRYVYPAPQPQPAMPQPQLSQPIRPPMPAATAAKQPWSRGQKTFVAIGAAVAAILLVIGVVFGMSMYRDAHSSPVSTASSSSDGTGGTSGSGSGETTDASCDSTPDMQVVSVERSGNDLVVTILVTSTCSDGSSTRFDDPKARITLKDASGETMADNTFDFSGKRARTVTANGTKVKVTYTPDMCKRSVTDIVDEANDDPSELIIRYIYRDRGGDSDDSGDSGDSATTDASTPPSSTLKRYENAAGRYAISVPDNFRKTGTTSDGTGFTFAGSGVTITTWRSDNTTGSAAGEMARLEANAGVPITYDLNADPSIYVSYYKGGYVYYIKEIVYADHIIGVQLKYSDEHRDVRDPLTEKIPPTLEDLG